MAGNTFDFELNADDQASQEIANIEAELNKLRPVLKDVRESLRMGGMNQFPDCGMSVNEFAICPIFRKKALKVSEI